MLTLAGAAAGRFLCGWLCPFGLKWRPSAATIEHSFVSWSKNSLTNLEYWATKKL